MSEQVRKASQNKLAAMLQQVKNHPNNQLTYYSASALRDRAARVFRRCEEVQEELVRNSADDTALGVQETAFAPIETTYHELRWRLQELLDSLPPPAVQSTSTTTNSTTGSGSVAIRLPAMELPTFDGNYANWLSFKDLFLATIDSNGQLSPAQKLQYLKSALQNEPASLINSMVITDGNYKEAWKILNERYSNDREIVFSLVNKVLSIKPINNESSTALQTLLDCTNQSLRSLQVLQQPTDKWDILIIAVLLRKLDASTRREWAIRSNSSTLPTFKEFEDFLKTHIRGLTATGAVSQPPQGKRKEGKFVGAHPTSTTVNNRCRICEGSHQHYQCEVFKKLPPRERSSLISKHSLCFNCLSPGHRMSDCKKPGCHRCGKKHHTMLHEGRPQPVTAVTPPPREDDNPNRGTTAGHSSVDSNPARVQTTVLLATAVIHVEDHSGALQLCRAFLDSGSQASFVSEDCARRLGLPRKYSRLTVSGISSSDGGTTKGKVHCRLYPSSRQHSTVEAELHILPRVTSDLPRYPCQKGNWNHLDGVQLADPHYYRPEKVDILVGADYLGQILLQGKKVGPPNTPIGQETIFGWVLYGSTPIEGNHCIITNHVTTEFDVLRRFWEVEEPPKASYLTKEEKMCEQHFIINHSRDKDGRFTVGVPFNEKKETLGLSRSSALRRLLQVERRLQRQPQHRQAYIDFMGEYEVMGHMEPIAYHEQPEEEGKTFYLPHHFVVNESSTTTKLRVVFDGSAKGTSGISLNDALMVGATIQDDLYNHLLRFRTYPIVLKGDIAKMFRQFRLTKEDADFHRILWRESHDQPVRDFRLTTVTYGTACAPFLSTRCLKQLAIDCKERYPLASAALMNHNYVDDLITGAKTTEEGVNLYNQLVDAVDTAGLELRKWASNNPDLLKQIPEEQRETNPFSFDKEQTVKTLGSQWEPSSDEIRFNHIPASTPDTLTKRGLLSDLAKVFDPLGLITPITIKAKLIFQELWKITESWDEPVPEEILQQWISYQEDMKNVSSINFPRCVVAEGAIRYELHNFSDASERAYGAAIYLRSIYEDRSASAQLVTSKSRVAPLRQIPLPRLELMAAKLLAELVVEVQEALKLEVQLFFWTDSTITLRWISASPRRWKTFVANRVATIQECSAIETWRHVPGTDNPADLVSRGVTARELLTNPFWLNGPAWLSQPGLPQFPMNRSVQRDTDMEERAVPVLTSQVDDYQDIIQRFSSLTRLQGVTARIMRLFWNSKFANKENTKTGPLSAEERRDGLKVWIKKVQHEHYAQDLKALRTSGNVPTTSKLRSLYPYIDNDGILRVAGRLHNANIPEGHRHQIILPASCHLTDLIIVYNHQLTMHGGFSLTWTTIQSNYWILGGRNKVRYYVRSCVRCRRFGAKAAQQLMGNLPASRVTPARPFLHTGVDYAGPFLLKNPVGRAPKSYKAYICLFVCMVTKAIHLEAVSSLSTEAFIATFRRFVSRRGLCAHLYSDRGTNFVGADKELKQLITSWTGNPEVPDHLSSIGINWHWNPSLCPHRGGLWESAVKSAKHHLRRVMGNTLVSYEQFSTTLCQVEAILNSRPLYPASADPSDMEALTPGHFLIGEPLLRVPDNNLTDISLNRLSLHQQQQQRVQQFWRRWSREYLNTLQQRNKWWWDKPDLEVGDLVLIVEDSAPGTWRMGRITAVERGHDNRVRVATVKTANSSYQRPIVKLIPLLKDK